MATDLSSRVRAIALLLAASAGISRLLGYGRDLLLNVAFGAGAETDIYRASFTVPDMLNYLLAGGALTVSLLPQLTGLYARLDREAGAEVGAHPDVDALFSKIASAMLAAVVVLVVVAEIYTESLVGLWVDGFDAAAIAQTATLTRIVLPAQIFFLSGGLIQAALLARQRFAALALTPLCYNGGIIVGGLVATATGDVSAFSWGALVGAAIGALLVPAIFARGVLRFMPRIPTFDADVRRFAWTALPLMIGVSLTTVDEWLGVRYGSRIGDGGISWLGSARRLLLVPIGLVGTAAGQATGAFVARLHAEGRRDELAALLGRALGAVAAISLLLSGFAWAAAEPIVGVLFEHGRFTRADTLQTAVLLQAMAPAIAGWGLHSVAARSLYGTGDTWRPMLASSVVTALSLPLYALLSERAGLTGLAWAGVVGMSGQGIAMCWLTRRRLGLQTPALLLAVARALPVALIAGAIARYVVDAVLAAVSVAAVAPGATAYLLALLAAALVWLVAVAALGTVFAVPGLAEVGKRLRSRVWRRPRA